MECLNVMMVSVSAICYLLYVDIFDQCWADVELRGEWSWTERLEKLAFIDILIISLTANMIPLYESNGNIFPSVSHRNVK